MDLRSDTANCGACALGADVRQSGGASACNGTPFCSRVRTMAGATRCVSVAFDAACGECPRDGDCGRLGAGASCVRAPGRCSWDDRHGVFGVPCPAG